MSLSLSALGLELDNIRRVRRGEDPSDSPPEETAPLPIPSARPASIASTSTSTASSLPSTASSLPSSSPTNSTSTSTSSPTESACLLCLTRAPSAVLLPCCHLNLCHLCAPLMILKASNDAASRASVVDNQARLLEDPEHIPFNVALSRAVRGNAKARRLSNGGYIAQRGCGGEYSGKEVLSGQLKRVHQDDGRLVLESVDEAPATCLVCRASVSGWLRVYT